MRPRRWPGSLLVLLALAACAGGGEEIDPPQPPAAVRILHVLPATVLPGTALQVTGRSFSAGVVYALKISGKKDGKPVNLTLRLQRRSAELATAALDRNLVLALGQGQLLGSGQVIASDDAGQTLGPSATVTLTFATRLTPSLSDVGDGLVYLNTEVPVVGKGLLLGGAEGHTEVEISGCFLPETASPPCATAGTQVRGARAQVAPDGADQRALGTFPFAPQLVGVAPGKLEGELTLVNIHGDGTVLRAASRQPISFYLDRTRLSRLKIGAASLGQYLPMEGEGFVGGSKGSTSVSFKGTFQPAAAGGKAEDLSFTLVPGFSSGTLLKYVMEEGQGIGAQIDLRKERGTLDGTWTPTVYWGAQQVAGRGARLKLAIAGVRQVVWLRYHDEWLTSLQQFGLAAADDRIRQRLLAVLRRDYKGINMDFRTSEPKDFKLFAKFDLRGKDPNGLGLLGYDNTAGKDVGNRRLYDWIGGVNASTQQDGFPGYGGVFLESLFGFSLHPLAGVRSTVLADEAFDRLFDPFRPDRGAAMTSGEALYAAALSSGGSCPSASGARLDQAACAIWALANVVGSTASHELGHSLGLANPDVPDHDFHNPGDRPNRLMDAGNARPFAERAQVQGKGPSLFCRDEFAYLQEILPLQPRPADPVPGRPSCQ